MKRLCQWIENFKVPCNRTLPRQVGVRFGTQQPIYCYKHQRVFMDFKVRADHALASYRADKKDARPAS